MDGVFWKPTGFCGSFSSNVIREGVSGAEDFALPAYVPSRAPLARQRMLLPIYKHRKQITYAVEYYGIVIIVGETGSGKSTQIPQYLRDAGWCSRDFTVVCTQPRRIAVATLASRVAKESGTTLGDQVGYTVRFDDKSSINTRIKYVTDAIILREATLSDPLLSKYSVVIVDEAHERSLNTDAVLGLLKKIRRKRRDLRIIVCSATIDARAFLEFFLRKDTTSTPSNDDKRHVSERGTIISVEGRQFPVDVLHVAEPVTNYVEAVVDTAYRIHDSESIQSGGILCFLPTSEDIDSCVRLAEHRFQSKIATVDLLPLHGNLPYSMQTRVFKNLQSKQQHQVRRVIFSSNMAETSVTVPNVGFVVDTGLVKLPYFDPRAGLERLILCPASQASVKQRTGRAGREKAGKCFRLYAEAFFRDKMQVHTPPEILRINLSSFLLTLKALGVGNVLAFDMMDMPSVDSLSFALETLFSLGAIDDQANITKLGLNMSRFPADPRVSRMLLASLEHGCSWEVLALAGALQVRDLIHNLRGRPKQQDQLEFQSMLDDLADISGDHVTYANLISEMDSLSMDEETCRARFLNYVALKRAQEIRDQLSTVLRRLGRVEGLGVGADEKERSAAIRRTVCAGFFGNVARLESDGRYYTLKSHILVTPAKSSVLSLMTTMSSEYILFNESTDGHKGGMELRCVSAIEARWLRETAPHFWE